MSHEIAAWKKKYIDDPASEPVKIPNPYPAQNTVVSNVSGIDPDRWLAEVDAKIADHIARQPTRKLLQGPRTFRERVAWLLFGDE